MLKKLYVFLSIFLLISFTVNAADFTVCCNDDGIKISGSAKNAGDTVNVTVWDKENNLLYVEEKNSSDSAKYEFRAGIDYQNGLKVKVGGNKLYSPYLKYIDDKNEYNIYYVSSAAGNNGNGSKEKPFATIDAAYNAASTGDMLYILGDAEWDITKKSDKAVTVSGGRIVFNEGNINVPLTLENIMVESNTTLTADKIFIGKNTEFVNSVDLTCNFASIKSGSFKVLTGNELHIYENVDVAKISDSEAVVLENTEYEEIFSNCKFIVKNGKGGSAELKDGKINLIPDDEAIRQINGLKSRFLRVILGNLPKNLPNLKNR